MAKIAIIGSGISGLAMAQLLKNKHDVTVFEKESEAGGLIKCKRVGGHLYHLVGGHLFNSLNREVFEWFWSFFDRETEFVKASRNAKILFNNKLIGYPIENHIYQLDDELVKRAIADFFALNMTEKAVNFEAFLLQNFGKTLYEAYFKPYNQKIWNTDLSQVPLPWLDGKLPMPDIQKVIFSNICRAGEKEMVHSSFYYPKQNGSQFIVDRFSKDLSITSNTEVQSIKLHDNKLVVNDEYNFDRIIFTGDVRQLHSILNGLNDNTLQSLMAVKDLKSNGTTNVLCEIEKSDLSWLYLPQPEIRAHRIIYTGNFSPSNNASPNKLSCVIEFSGKLTEQKIIDELKLLPYQIKPISINYQAASYVIQNHDTRQKIEEIRLKLEPLGFYLLGRFAEWEYYNMDKCMESAMRIKLKIESSKLFKLS
jgi:protoporphyrinogen oxidase